MNIGKMGLFSGLLAALIAIALIGCASGASSGGAVPIGDATGKATGTAQGFGGEIKVTITMDKGFITDVVVVGDAETPSLGSIAIVRAPGMIKSRNSADLDAISNATITTLGISEAAQAAIDKIVAGK